MNKTASAPGKLFLMGEHAVVFGYSSLVAAVDRRIYIDVSKNKVRDEILAPGVDNARFVEAARDYFRKKYKIRESILITTEADFSDSLGLGSSAATTAATVYVLNDFFKKKLSLKKIFETSFKSILQIEKRAAGADIAAAVFGGVVYYTKRGKIIEPVSVRTALPLMVAYSGTKASTPALVAGVLSLYRRKPSFVKNIFDSMESIVKEGKTQLKAGNFVNFGHLLIRHHQLLQKLNISTPKLDRMVSVAVAAGAWGAKLSGAGGGDCMIAFVKDDKRQKVKAAIESVGGQIIDLQMTMEGVRPDIL